jgi:hypothetical protein
LREFTDGNLKTSASKWTSGVTEQAVPGETGARDLQVHFKLTDGEAKSAGVAVAFDFAN